MKSYDQTVDAVFDRIHTYETKKKHRTALTRRITAACCAVALLGGSAWYLNRHPMDTPIQGIATGDNTTRTNASDAGTTSPTTTSPTEEIIIITADEPEPHGLTAADWPRYIISPALEEKMTLHKNEDVFYYVIVEIYISVQDDHDLTATDEELIQLAQRRNAACSEWMAVLKKDNPAGPLESGKWAVVSDEARMKEDIFITIADEYEELLEQKRIIYYNSLSAQRAQELQTVSSIAPISISTDSRFTPYFALNSNYAFFMTLTADEINALSNLTGYIIRLAHPDGDSINNEDKSSLTIS